ncbi:MAG: hypothetical protein O2931_02770 [Planctomycetota bacterium]|nr:hypothetical protein [Planctomycetota bacterium]MDA1177699.1 hypothetical protein [Planctomycetota bacterium]
MARMVRRAEEWERLVRRQTASGMTVAKFCEMSSVSVPSFYYWKRRLEAGSRPKKKQARESGGLFRQVTLTAGPALAVQATVRFPSGVELTFGCDPVLVRQVVGQLMATRDSHGEI